MADHFRTLYNLNKNAILPSPCPLPSGEGSFGLALLLKNMNKFCRGRRPRRPVLLGFRILFAISITYDLFPALFIIEISFYPLPMGEGKLDRWDGVLDVPPVNSRSKFTSHSRVMFTTHDRVDDYH